MRDISNGSTPVYVNCSLNINKTHEILNVKTCLFGIKVYQEFIVQRFFKI